MLYTNQRLLYITLLYLIAAALRDDAGGLTPALNKLIRPPLFKILDPPLFIYCGLTESKTRYLYLMKSASGAVSQFIVTGDETLIFCPVLTSGTRLSSVHCGVYRLRPPPTTHSASSYRSVDHPARVQLARRHDKIRAGRRNNVVYDGSGDELEHWADRGPRTGSGLEL